MMKSTFLLSFTLILFSLFQLQAQDIMLLKTSGKVVIGDTSLISTPGPYNLYVQNGILTEKVKVSLRNTAEWADHAFYTVPSIEEIKNSIEKDSHLLNMPSAQSLVKEGYELQSMDAKLLTQIEWLWQHTIKLKEENEQLKRELSEIKVLLQK